MNLGIDEQELASCVGCGLCLPHCPTYRVTLDEARSPRGRIATMRQVQWLGMPLDAAVLDSIDTCVQCRGCEPACPSGVPFGHLMEATRATLASQHRGYVPWYRRLGFAALGHPRLVRAGSLALAVAQRARLVPSARLGLPARLPLRRPPLRSTVAAAPSATKVWLFTGCVMDAWQRDVHLAVQRVLEAAGAAVTPTGAAAPCCGALAEHAGLSGQHHRHAQHVMSALAGDAPIVVDSAGCGAAMKDYGRVLGTAEARAFSARVVDAAEWLAPRIASLPAPTGAKPVVAVQDPCHLRHVQRAHQHVRTVLAPFAELRELDDDGLCCGAGGAYSVLQPDLARDVRARKVGAIGRTGAPLVVSSNPGCAMHLAATGLTVRHPFEIIDDALSRR